jgi:hypothetical protein
VAKQRSNLGNKPEESLPHPVGRTFVTDAERKILEQFDWKDGDPLPDANFARVYKSELAKQEQETQAELSKLIRSKRPDVKVPQEVDIKELPEHRQQELRSILATAKEQKANPASALPMEPALAQAVQDLASDRVPQIKAKTSFTSEKKAQVAPVAGTAPEPTECQHCGCSLTEPAAEPTPEDARNFAETLLLGQSYTKTYSFMGGRLKVAFRTLTEKAANLSMQQAGLDTTTGDVKTITEFIPRLISYRMVLAFKSLWVNDVEYDIEEMVDEYLAEAKKEIGSTVLPKLLNTLQGFKPLDQEPIWRMLSLEYQHFARLAAGLGARVKDPNFWGAIAG